MRKHVFVSPYYEDDIPALAEMMRSISDQLAIAIANARNVAELRARAQDMAALTEVVITSYSIHYTKLYEPCAARFGKCAIMKQRYLSGKSGRIIPCNGSYNFV